MILTAEQIAKEASSIRAANRMLREQDESHLWPIRNKFNATERAIRRARQLQQYVGTMSILEYCYAVEGILSEIINDPKNQ